MYSQFAKSISTTVSQHTEQRLGHTITSSVPCGRGAHGLASSSCYRPESSSSSLHLMVWVQLQTHRRRGVVVVVSLSSPLSLIIRSIVIVVMDSPPSSSWCRHRCHLPVVPVVPSSSVCCGCGCAPVLNALFCLQPPHRSLVIAMGCCG